MCETSGTCEGEEKCLSLVGNPKKTNLCIDMRVCETYVALPTNGCACYICACPKRSVDFFMESF
jgi:hypothetical protein